MTPTDHFPPTLAAAHRRIAAVRPADYARSRNAIDGAVTGLSPYLTHGFVNLREVLQGVLARHPLHAQHKFVFELGWRAYFRHVWRHRGNGILQSLHDGPLPGHCYAPAMPADILQGQTGVPVIDMAVRTLYATGWLHNHARMWLASYVVHVRKVHWRAGADWLYGHLLDGDIASNHLGWQWVAGTGSRKPYLFNADNVARYAPAPWHSAGSVIDTTYDALDQMARDPMALWTIARDGMANNHRQADLQASGQPAVEPRLLPAPPQSGGWTAPDPAAVSGRDVWLVHPWSLGEPPAWLPADTLVIGVAVADFHRAWPWSGQRWRWVEARMSELTPLRWFAEASAIGAALKGARRVRALQDPHLAPWLVRWAEGVDAPSLFPDLERRCDAFMPWWKAVSRGLDSAADLLGDASTGVPVKPAR